jgi:hypothetical protein
MNRRQLLLSGLALPLLSAEPSGLDQALAKVAPGLKKWASVCIITGSQEAPQFSWYSYGDTAQRIDYWPASCVKLYTMVAALELVEELGFSLDTTCSFAHREEGRWVTDCARTLQEMISEVCRRSSNEDYTLLLRLVGLDRINTQFLVSERGFPSSALMRGYVAGGHWKYDRQQAQRIILTNPDGKRHVIEHKWSGRFYAEERGCNVIDAKTGNCTSPRELAECMRRILFHEHLPEAERYRLSADALKSLSGSNPGWTSLETKEPDSGPSAWIGGLEQVCPKAQFWHKCGLISNYALDTFCVKSDQLWMIAVPVVNAGHATEQKGEPVVAEMSRAIYDWALRR